MPMSTLPPQGDTDWYDHYKKADQILRAFGAAAFDSFDGDTDDAKLTSALAYVASQTVKPAIVLPSRQLNFSQMGRALFSGLKIIQPFGFGNQQRSANSIPCDVRVTGSGTWWTGGGASNIYDVMFAGFGAQGGADRVFMDLGSTVLWTSVMRDLGFNLWKHVLGTPTSKLLLTACLFDGWWNINNGRDTACTVGGSDNNLWMGGGLVDSPQSLSKSGAYHLIFDYLEKTQVGPLFITADGPVGGILIKGSANASALTLLGQGRCEGRNATQPCFGSSIRMEGGAVTISDWELHYGMFSPGAIDKGIITKTGGKLLLSRIWYDRARSVAETVPLLHQSGGYTRIRDVMTGDKDAANNPQQWSEYPGYPRVQSTGGILKPDDSVVVL